MKNGFKPIMVKLSYLCTLIDRPYCHNIMKYILELIQTWIPYRNVLYLKRNINDITW